MLRSLALASTVSVLSVSLLGCGHHKPHARASDMPAGPAQANAQLDAIADDQAKAASARRSGARTGELLHGETSRPGEAQEFRVPLDADHCYWIGGATDEMGQRITISLVDPKGASVASEKGKEKDTLLEYCPAMDGIYKVEGKPQHHGQFSLAVYGGTRIVAAVAPVGASAEDLIAKEAAAAAPGAKQVGAFFEGSADEPSWSTALKGGRCYWFIGAGVGKVKKLSLYVWDPKNHRITDNKADSNVSTVGHCAKETGMFKFQAKVHSGSGSYKVAVYEKE